MLIDGLLGVLRELAGAAAAADPWQQVACFIGFGAIPFVESHGGAVIGAIAGLPPALTVSAAILGNLVCTFALIALADRTRRAVSSRRRADTLSLSGEVPLAQPRLSRSQRKVQRAFERYGVPGVCLLGPTVIASQITGPALIALGAPATRVYLFQGIAIVAWGIGAALLAGAAFARIGTLA